MSAQIPATVLDRIMTFFRQLVRAEFARASFFGLYEYAVQSGSGTSYELAPTDNTLTLPGSKGVPLRLSLATADLPKGSLVVLAFLNGDPSRACVVGAAPQPTNMTLDVTATMNLGPSATLVKLAGGGAGIARNGDQIQISIAQFAAASPSNSGGPVAIAAPMLGSITSGSSKAQSG
jgi:hypothetical protein